MESMENLDPEASKWDEGELIYRPPAAAIQDICS